MNKYFTAQEVADRLKIKKSTVYELIKRGELASSKIGKQLRISESQLSSYLQESVSENSSNFNNDFIPESSLLKRDYLKNHSGLIISGQSCEPLQLFLSNMATLPKGLPLLQSHINSYNGLYSLYFDKVHVSLCSLSPTAIGNLVPGIPLVALCLCEYNIGFYVKDGNPKNIVSIESLLDKNIIFINREKGSSRRVFLDQMLTKRQISSSKIRGYENEQVSDLALATSILNGNADVAIGEESIAKKIGSIKFISLAKKPLFLVFKASELNSAAYQNIIKTVQNPTFKNSLNLQGYYDTSNTGKIYSI